MKLKSIEFSDGDEGCADPRAITVTMTLEEAIWIALVSGKQRGESPHNGIYTCLVGDVFNRYWDDGVDDARKSHPVELPPIVYTSKSAPAQD